MIIGRDQPIEQDKLLFAVLCLVCEKTNLILGIEKLGFAAMKAGEALSSLKSIFIKLNPLLIIKTEPHGGNYEH